MPESPPEQAPTSPIVLGKIVGAYGVQGWVHIHPFGDDPLSWKKIRDWRMTSDPEGLAGWQPLGLRSLKVHAGGLVAAFNDVVDRSGAEALVGRLVGVPRTALPQPAEGEYYWNDLVGMTVLNRSSERVGVVRDLLETGANSVLVVLDDAGREHLLPFVAAVVDTVDLDARTICVDWGLDW